MRMGEGLENSPIVAGGLPSQSLLSGQIDDEFGSNQKEIHRFT